MNKTEKLNEALQSLQRGSADFEAGIIFSEDGLVIASFLPADMNESHVVTMVSTMLAMGNRTTYELQCGKVEQLLVKGENGYIIVTPLGTYAAFITIARKDAKLGRLLGDVDSIKKTIIATLAL